jgi:hypothetical protein
MHREQHGTVEDERPGVLALLDIGRAADACLA